MRKIIIGDLVDEDVANYDEFFRQRVQTAISDNRPSVSTIEARHKMANARASLLNKSQLKIKED